MPQLRSAVGFVALLALAWLLSANRRRFPLRTVLGGVLLQFCLALLVLRTQSGALLFEQIGRLVSTLIAATDAGASFVFGNLVENKPDQWGFVFAAKALPNIIVFSALSAIGYHLGLLQRIVAAMAWVMQKLMRVSGAESLSAAANVFVGQTEAPLFVRPYIARMTDSELNAVMVGGFATIAGSLMAVYPIMLGHNDAALTAEFAKHLLSASLISAPAGLVVAKLMLPELGQPETAGTVRLDMERTTRSALDAAASGAVEGLKLALNVGAMLIAFIALIKLVDWSLIAVGRVPGIAELLASAGVAQLNLDAVLGRLFWPIAWLIGNPPESCMSFGGLLGKAMAANEFIAYRDLGEMVQTGTLPPRSQTLAVYALCGFANFSSIAIQIAGIGGMAPNRYHDLARLGLRAMLGGAIACWMTACVAGILL